MSKIEPRVPYESRVHMRVGEIFGTHTVSKTEPRVPSENRVHFTVYESWGVLETEPRIPYESRVNITVRYESGKISLFHRPRVGSHPRAESMLHEM